MEKKQQLIIPKSIQKDISVSQFPSDAAIDMRNMRVVTTGDSTTLCLVNERGNSKELEITGTIIGVQAINNYISWQKEKLGRDINPTELYYRIRDAGAKYADIRSPSGRIIVADNEMAVAEDVSITYGGIEDD